MKTLIEKALPGKGETKITLVESIINYSTGKNVAVGPKNRLPDVLLVGHQKD